LFCGNFLTRSRGTVVVNSQEGVVAELADVGKRAVKPEAKLTENTQGPMDAMIFPLKAARQDGSSD